MQDFSFLRTLLDFQDEISDNALVPEDFLLALDEMIFRTIEYDYQRMIEERA